MKNSLLGKYGLIFALISGFSYGQNAILTFQNLISAQSEIEFLRVWEKLSVAERQKAQRLFSFQAVSMKDIKPEGIAETILGEAVKASAKKPGILQFTLEPEMETFQVTVSVSECPSAWYLPRFPFLFMGNSVAYAQGANSGASTSVRNRTWWDEVKSELCLQPFELTKKMFCEGPEISQTLAPSFPKQKDVSLSSQAFQDNPQPMSDCDKPVLVTWKFLKETGALLTIRSSSLMDEIKKNAALEALREKIVSVATKRRISRDQAKSGIAEGDYLKVASLQNRDTLLKLGLFLNQQTVTDRDLENPCPKLGAFFKIYRSEPSSNYVERCMSASGVQSKKIQFPLTPKYSPAQTSNREQIMGYHSQSVRIANHVLSAISRAGNSKIVLSSDNPIFQKIEFAIEKGLFSFLASEVASYARTKFTDPGFDLEAKIALEVISFFKSSDTAQVAYENEGLGELIVFYNLLKGLLDEVPDSAESDVQQLKAKTASMIEEQILLLQKIQAEISRRKT